MILIISGTNRRGAKSYRLAGLLKKVLAEQQTQSEILDLDALPADFTRTALYEENGKNEAFNALAAKVPEAEKVIFVIAEYNGSFPGILKTFIDALPYPNPLAGKKAGLVGLSAGPMGGTLALSHFTDILNYLGVHVAAHKFRLPFVDSAFDAETLALTQKRSQGELAKFITQLLAF